MATTRKHLGPKFSEGSRLLWLALASRGLSQNAVCREVGCSDGHVNRWLYGDRGITLNFAVKLFKLYGIEVETWDAKPTERFRPPARVARAA